MSKLCIETDTVKVRAEGENMIDAIQGIQSALNAWVHARDRTIQNILQVERANNAALHRHQQWLLARHRQRQKAGERRWH